MGLNERILALSVMAKDDATATLNRVDATLKNLGVRADGTGKAFLGLNSGMGSMAGALAAGVAIGAVTGFLAQSTRAAIEEEQQVSKLTASLKANLPAWDGNTAAIKEATKSRLDLAFSDGEIRDSLSLLIASTHDMSRAQEIQNTAMDLARFKGISLQEASEALVKVEGGRFRMLQSLGIKLKDNATATEALAAVQKVAAGQAEAYGQTTEGAMKSAAIAVNDLQEDIGAQLTPAIRDATIAFRDMLPAIKDAAGAVGDFARWMNSFTGVNQFTDALEAQARQLQQNTGVTRVAGESAKDYLVRIAKIAPELDHTKRGLDSSTDGLVSQTQAMGEAEAGAAAFHQELYKGADYYHQYTTAAQDTGAGLDNVAGRAIAAAHAIDVSGDAALRAAAKMNALAAAQIAVNRNLPGGTADAQRQFTYNTGGDQAALDAAQRAFEQSQSYIASQSHTSSGGGSSGPAKAANDLAKALRDNVVKAYEAAQTAGDRYYDEQHTQNQKAIDAAHKLAQAKIDEAHRAANEEIAAARRAVDAQLADQLRLNAAPVTAAEKALRDTQNAQQLRDLQESLAQAQQGGDPIAIRNAQEALSNFLAQQNIDMLREQQAQADAQAQDKAKAAQEELDKQQAAEDATYASRTAAEDAKYADRQHDEDERWKRQKATFDAHITAMENSKTASEGLARAEMLRFLQEQYKLALSSGTAQDQRYAKADLDAFIKNTPKHAAGLGYVPNDNYLAFLHQGEMVVPAGPAAALRGGAGGSFAIHPGAIVINGGRDSAEQIADAVIYAIERKMSKHNLSSLRAR